VEGQDLVVVRKTSSLDFSFNDLCRTDSPRGTSLLLDLKVLPCNHLRLEWHHDPGRKKDSSEKRDMTSLLLSTAGQMIFVIESWEKSASARDHRRHCAGQAGTTWYTLNHWMACGVWRFGRDIGIASETPRIEKGV